MRNLKGKLLILLGILAVALAATNSSPALTVPRAIAKREQTAVFGGGCFWGMQAVFEHVKGVNRVTAGYSGGSAERANYEAVSMGDTGHAEAVRITYDPTQITYSQLLKVFFSVAHDPTELNRQGPDEGTQYRSVIFYSDSQQRQVAQAYINQLNQAKVFATPIVTQVAPLHSFYKAESYHQDFAVTHPNDSYIVINDLPKVARLRKELPELYVAK